MVHDDADTWTDREVTGTDVQLVAPPTAVDHRYRVEGTLGSGGVGVVSMQFDRCIGRRVATKRLRSTMARDPVVRARFLREAQVQGQLEHPAVVPVYDLGTDPDGALFFTMKSISGTTLADILDDLREGDEDALRRYPRHRLLNAFAGVCLAIDFAHQRGILHRDLKPANLMLGDFGEVYVLDWGLAKIRGTPDDPLLLDDNDVAITGTNSGVLLGTPGYMAPEQIRDPGTVGVAADVYALGAILFELLTLEPLHVGPTPMALIAATQQAVEARPSVRAPARAIDPELEDACVAATALDPRARLAGARELHDAVQAYLAGEHDLAERRSKAAAHADRAEAAAQRVLAGAGTLDDRRHAMRELGRALALDPAHPRAVATMVTLLTDPPKETPPEVAYELDKGYRADSRWAGRAGAIVYPAQLLLLPVMAWMGIREPGVLVFLAGLMIACAVLSLLVLRQVLPPVGPTVGSMVLSSVAFACVARLGSSVLLVPTILAVNAAGYAIFLPRRYRAWIAITSVLGFLVPLVLELTGVLSRTVTFTGGHLVVLPHALGLPATPTLVLIAVASTSAILTGTFLVGHIRDRLADAERRMYLYTWHLREFVPPTARQATDRELTAREP